MVSSENAEKVVNPPRRPVAKKSFHSAEMFPFSDKWKTAPIKKQPIIFINKVPKGNIEVTLL